MKNRRQLRARTLGELLYMIKVEQERKGIKQSAFEQVEMNGVLTIVCKN